MRLLKQNAKGDLVFTPMLYDPPPYAILSHTWSTVPDAEVTYQDVLNGSAVKKESFAKIQFIAERAKAENIEHFWVDNCCIDKKNEAEVSTAIRSMYHWYERSKVCFVYLADVSVNKRDHDGQQTWEGGFRKCRWFERGWTLQELIAPTRVEFYAREQYLGSRASLSQQIHEITGIYTEVLQGKSHKECAVSTRRRWAIGRATTIPEDYIYALMGLCDVVMSPKYGEGKAKAEERLERKIRSRRGESAVHQSTWPAYSDQNNEKISDHQLEERKGKLEALRFDMIHSRRTDITKALRQTCNWILNHPTYLTWMDTEANKPHSGFFWIKGKPGAGKSVLVKHLDTHISKQKAEQDICLSFYFHARGEQLEKSLEGMYRSLLTQLLEAKEDLQCVLDGSGSSLGDSRAAPPKLAELLLAAIMKLKDQRLFCFIDALDECDDLDMQQMINFFRNLCEEATKEGVHVNVCFASRHYPALNIPTDLQLVLEDLVEHKHDLGKYVKSQKFSCGSAGKPTSIPEQVQNDILEKANGVFLWIVLVVDILQKEFLNGRVHAVQRRLREIPQDLTLLFKNIVQRDQENIGEFLLCLRWILYAKRPLVLREFYFAMMAGIGEQSLEWNPDVSDDIMHNFLRSSSKGLAELTKGKNRRAQFIHESVRDFLLTKEGFSYIESTYDASACKAHEALKDCCILGIEVDANTCLQTMAVTYPIDPDATTSQSSRRRNERVSLIDRFPFLEYATYMIFYHSDQAAPEISQKDFIRHFDLDQWRAKANFLQQHEINVYSPDVDLAYILAERDCADLIRILAEQGAELNTRSGNRNRIPLIAAFANKCMNAARVLLEQEDAQDPAGIALDVIVNNYKGRRAYDLSEGQPAWQWATEQGLLSLARHFLRDVRNDDTTADAFSRSIRSVSKKGHVQMAKLLIERGADVNAQGGVYGNNVLQAASKKGYAETVKLLLEQGADANAPGGLYGNALRAAIETGYIEIVKLLLEHGADVNAPGGLYGNVAIQRGYAEIVKLLLEHGADVNALGGLYGNNALRAAVQTGYIEIVKLLLEHGADVNAPGELYGNVLEVAIQRGYAEIVKLLLEHGVDIKGLRGRYCNVLPAGCSHEDVEAILTAYSAL